MRILLLVGLILSVNLSHGSNPPMIKLYEPVIRNIITDKYVPASNQVISGFLGYRMDVNLEKRLLQIDSTTILSGFRKRPGSQVWLGEHTGKFLFSAANTIKYRDDERLKKLAHGIVLPYIACQLPDGYLGTYLPKDYWTEWDVWAHKYAIIGLLSYYSVTGYAPALNAAKKAGDLICNTFGDEPGKRDLMTAGWHVGLAPGSILEPMTDLYRYTGDRKYLGFCEYILRAFEHPNGPKIISSLEKYGQVTKVGNGKAYEMLSCFLGILKYYKITGDVRYLKALETAWTDICENRLYITGTSSVEEHFQEDGIMPAENQNNMGEGCVTTTWLQFNLQLLQITGEQKYAEELERSIYNHLFAAENPQTGCVSYYTALQGSKPYKCDQGFSCCLSSIPRGISLIPDLVWGKINGIFSILMLESGVVNDTILTYDHSKIAIKIESLTNFPIKGLVEYKISPSMPKKFALSFRVPEWSKNYIATIGKESYSGKQGQLLSITRMWRANDVVRVTFDIPFTIVDGGKSYPGKVAIKRGPQVLSADKALNPEPESFKVLNFLSANLKPTDVSNTLPADWSWKQAYSIPMDIDKRAGNIILVPFSEAGQKGSEIATWIEGK